MALNIQPKVENQGLTANGRLTATEFNQLLAQVKLNTPTEVASEEVLAQMVQDGTIVEGQVYYVAEES